LSKLKPHPYSADDKLGRIKRDVEKVTTDESAEHNVLHELDQSLTRQT
jgi:hypothetical protein